jgi:activator of HSP90 ATPase
MSSDLVSRRSFSVRIAALLPSLVAFRPMDWAGTARRVASDEVTYTSEAIHQEVTFRATPQQVYAALTEPRGFGRVVELSGAMAGAPQGTATAVISPTIGGAFSLFGGQIVGRHLELVPGERLVQGWRVAGWKPGIFSIARFELSAQGSGTQLTFDHTGFPAGAGKSLASGWTEHYWQPLAKYLVE